jgi:hypothetical protein
MSPRAASVLVTPLGGSNPIRTGPGTAIPSHFTAMVDDPAQPFLLELVVKTVAGRRPEVVEMRMSVRDLTAPDGGVTTEKMRPVKVAKALTMALAQATRRIHDDGSGMFRPVDELPVMGWSTDEVAKPVRGAAISDEFLKLVASTYRTAVASGSRSPVLDLQTHLGGSRATAGRWVVQARKAGFLRPTVGTRPGEITPKARSRNTAAQ